MEACCTYLHDYYASHALCHYDRHSIYQERIKWWQGWMVYFWWHTSSPSKQGTSSGELHNLWSNYYKITEQILSFLLTCSFLPTSLQCLFDISEWKCLHSLLYASTQDRLFYIVTNVYECIWLFRTGRCYNFINFAWNAQLWWLEICKITLLQLLLYSCKIIIIMLMFVNTKCETFAFAFYKSHWEITLRNG